MKDWQATNDSNEWLWIADYGYVVNLPVSEYYFPDSNFSQDKNSGVGKRGRSVGTHFDLKI